MTVLTVGYSSCPNDVFIFEPLISGRVEAPEHRFEPLIEDVEALNLRARSRQLDVTKISFHAFGHLRDTHVLLDAGSALGRGCGPLVVARTPLERGTLAKCRIAIPGALTTAALLLRLYAPGADDFEILVFDEIIDAVRRGEVDAGVIIHESRFTYSKAGLVPVVDLGDWWEAETGLPIPLGGIIADRRLGEETIRRFDAWLRQSVLYAHEHPAAIWEAIRRHAQELDDDVIRSHIDLYVTEFTTSLGDLGRRSLATFFERAEEAGVVPKTARSDYLLAP